MQQNRPAHLFDLPDCMLEQIFEYMNYDEIARKRVICKRFDMTGRRLLNRGFNKMMKDQSTHLKRLKAQLPRRESERRSHPLARHTDILTCVETRISMLSMTYSKYIDLNLCCFIPGKVIDEVHQILKLVQTSTKPLRAHEVLQELRDISSMAMEHFDEKIATRLKKSYIHICGPSTSNDSVLSLGPPPPDIIPRTCDGTSQCEQARANKLALVRMEVKYKNAIRKFNQMIHLQTKQMRYLRCNSLRISQMTSQMSELKRQLEESDAKSREMKENINQIAQEAGASLPPTTITTPSTTAAAASTIRNIKPRAATIILKRRITEPVFDPADYQDIKEMKLE